MNEDEVKSIDVEVKMIINKKLVVLALLGVSLSIVLTGLLVYNFGSDLIPTLACIIIGSTLIFLSSYFPLTSPNLFMVNSKIIDIEEEELEELQSVMKPW